MAPIALNSCVTNTDLISRKITASGWGETEHGYLHDLMKGVQRITGTNAIIGGARVNERYHLQGIQAPNGAGICYGDSGGKIYHKTAYKYIYYGHINWKLVIHCDVIILCISLYNRSWNDQC